MKRCSLSPARSAIIPLFTFSIFSLISCGKTSSQLTSVSSYEPSSYSSASNGASSSNSVASPVPVAENDTELPIEKGANLSVQQELFSGAVKEKDFLLPVATILGPNALEQVFKPIFGDKPRFGVSANIFFTSFPNQFFLPKERSDLGDFRISGPVAGTTFEQSTSVSFSKEIKSQYLFALRSFAADACTGLVTKELEANSDTNRLVHKAPLKSEKVNLFFAKLIRRQAASNLFSGVAEYTRLTASAIEQSETAATPKDKSKLLKDSWVQLCVAMCTDPRVFLK